MINERIFGTLQSGEQVTAYTLVNGNVSAVILNYGCTVQSLCIALKDGTMRDVVLGYDTPHEYEQGISGQGGFTGQCANRITRAEFELGGKKYKLSQNDGKNHLHGVYSKKLFKGEINGESLILRAESPSGEDGFPGNISLTVTYTLLPDGALSIVYNAQTDEETIINLTNHSYFNLDGHAAGTALDHTLWLNCKSFCEADAETCTTGNILPVSNTPMDFTNAKPIGLDIGADYLQLRQAQGYDHNFIIDKPKNELALCAMAKSTDSAVVMECFTTQPALQLYTANYLNETGKGGADYKQYNAFCLETQHYPCTPSHAHFPSIVLNKGEEYNHTTIYKLFEL